MSSYDQQINTKYNTSSNRGKEEWQKNALRICGNWSEQLSSKGKVYFYNCVTEVSQWQKPVEWSLPDIEKRDLARFADTRRENSKRNSVSNPDSEIPSKKYRVDEEYFSSVDKNRRSTTNGGSKLVDDMEISPHTSPSDRSNRRSSNSTKMSSNSNQQQPTTLKKLVDVLESLDNLLTSTSSMKKKNVNSCSPNSSNKSISIDFKRAPPPPPPPLNNPSANKNIPGKYSQHKDPNVNYDGNNQKTSSTLTNTLNSLVSLLHHKSNKKHTRTTPNSTPNTNSSNNKLHLSSKHENIHSNNLHGNHSSPNQNSRLSSSNMRNNLISPSRNFSPASINNDHVSGTGDNSITIRDGQAVSYRDHRLQKQRSNNEYGRENKTSESECIVEQSLNGNNSIHSTSDAFQLQAASRSFDDQSDGIDKNQKLYHRINSLFQSPDIIKYTERNIIEKFNDNHNARLLTEISNEAKKFDQLHNVLYSELSCEMKKLQSLLLFSEVKLECHEKKRMALNKLLEELEARKPLENKSFSDLII